MSWSIISREALDSIIPVRPPMVKSKINPRVQRTGVGYLMRLPWRVAIHLNTLIPVGIAIIIVAEVK